MRTLPRACLGCSRPVRGKPRCVDCERDYQRAKRAKRADLYNDAAERRRRAMVVADHRAIVGDWCPGWAGQPAHQSADLTADHVKEVAAGGRATGRLVVRCRSCNAARSAHLARRAMAALRAGPDPGRRWSATPTLAPPGDEHDRREPANQQRTPQRSDQRFPPKGTPPSTLRPPKFPTHAAGDDDPGPVAA